jgi:hypothetical protein
MKKWFLSRMDTQEKFAFHDGPVFIGSAEWKVDICLQSPRVAEVHCEVSPEASGIRFESFVTDGSSVNGRVVNSAILILGDILVLGDVSFRVESDSSALVPHVSHSRDGDIREVASDGCPPADGGIVDERNETWFARLGRIELGPMPWSAIDEMLQRRELCLVDVVRRSAESAWEQVGEVLEERQHAGNRSPSSGGINRPGIRVSAHDNEPAPVIVKSDVNVSSSGRQSRDTALRPPVAKFSGVESSACGGSVESVTTASTKQAEQTPEVTTPASHN